MGRLLRTKKTEKKKKPGEGGEPTAPAGEEVAQTTEKTVAEASTPDTQKKKQPVPQKKPIALPIKIGYLEKGLQFLRESKAELKKVTWPSKKQTIGSTAVVIVLVMIISLFLGLVDMTLSSLMHIVLQ